MISGNRAGYSGGIENESGGTVTLTNTIVAGNTTFHSGPDLLGTIATGGHNLFGTTSGATITLGPGDLVNPPLLGPLGSFGGPTQTIPLLAGSPAIDAGSDAVCAGATVGNKDQRGITRPFGVHCDIGAFEYQVVNPLPPPRPAGPEPAPGGASGGSVRRADTEPAAGAPALERQQPDRTRSPCGGEREGGGGDGGTTGERAA